MSKFVARRDPGLLLVLLIAALARLPTLRQQSFWSDEAATLHVLHRSFVGMFPAIAHHESTPPLYYVLAWISAHVLGYSEGAVRSVSAAAGIATVWAIYACVRRIASSRAAAVTGLLAAVNPLLVWYSQEARSYALLAFFGALSFHLAAQAVDISDASPWRLWKWAITGALALGAHYFAVLYVVPEAAWLMWRRRSAARLPVSTVAVAGGVLLPLALTQRSTGRTDWITGTPLHTRLALIPKQFVSGPSAPHQIVLAAAGLAGVLIALAMLARRRRRVPEAALVALGIAMGAPIAIWLLALAGVDLVLTRNAIGILPIALVAVGVGIELLLVERRSGAAVLAASAITVVGLVAVLAGITSQRYQRTDWRDAARLLTASRAAHLVVLDPGSAQLPLGVYIELQRSSVRRRLPTREIDVVRFLLTIQGARRSADPTLVIPRGFHPRPPTVWPGLSVQRFFSSRPRPGDVTAPGSSILRIRVG